MSETKPIYLGEARLLRWAHSDSAGRTITLELPDDAPRHPFEGIPTGKEYGQRMQICCVAIDDHEQPVQAEHVRKRKGKRAPSGAAGSPPSQPAAMNAATEAAVEPKIEHVLCQEAGRYLKSPEFQTWVRGEYCTKFGLRHGEDTDPDRMLKILIGGLESKCDLDRFPEAGRKWSALKTDFDLRHTVRA